MDKIPERLGQFKWLSDLEVIVNSRFSSDVPDNPVTWSLLKNKGPEDCYIRDESDPYRGFPRLNYIRGKGSKVKESSSEILKRLVEKLKELERLGAENL